MDLDLRGRKGPVIGACKGIGAAVARAFAAEGCDFVLVARSADALGDLSVEIERDLGTAVATTVLDPTAADAIARLATVEGVDVLVNVGAIPGAISGPSAPRSGASPGSSRKGVCPTTAGCRIVR